MASTQVAKVDQCQLKMVSHLAFDFAYGTCVSTTDKESIYLCFDLNNDKLCRHSSTGPSGVFQKLKTSSFKHQATRIATNEKVILAVGGVTKEDGTKAEVLSVDSSSQSWRTISSYPFVHERIYDAPVIFFGESFYMFGGTTGV